MFTEHLENTFTCIAYICASY